MNIPINTPYSIRLGVVGAGTMGAGIALTALLNNMIVSLYDVSPEVLEKGQAYIQSHLKRKKKEVCFKNLFPTTRLEDMSGAGVVIEAIPEDLALKQELFARLDALCPPPAILATNTSTLPVTAIAAATTAPERVAGMHFFNPAPVLPLVEIINGARTRPEAARTLIALAERLGKTPVVARDTPGFIVNRVARPFYGEALRLVGEGVATPAEIDRLVRMGAGFRMGPFELMDLIGIDVNFSATQSMWEQTFGEPRYRPHLIQAQMVQQKALGRKTGRGFYSYDPTPPAVDPAPPRLAKRSGVLILSGGSWAPGLETLCRQAGYTLQRLEEGWNEPGATPLAGIVQSGRREGLAEQVALMDIRLPPDVPLLVQCSDIGLYEVAARLGRSRRLVGFDGLFLASGRAASLTATEELSRTARAGSEALLSSLGRLSVWVQDSPGLVLPRIIAMLANEAAFAAGEGVAAAETIDTAMQLGTNYPHGPLAWARELGYARVTTVLDHLREEYGEERYRVAPLLRRWSRLEPDSGE